MGCGYIALRVERIAVSICFENTWRVSFRSHVRSSASSNDCEAFSARFSEMQLVEHLQRLKQRDSMHLVTSRDLKEGPSHRSETNGIQIEHETRYDCSY